MSSSVPCCAAPVLQMRATLRRVTTSVSVRPTVRPLSLPIAGVGRLPLIRGLSTHGGSSGSQSGAGARWSAVPLAAVAAVAGVYVLNERSKPARNDAKAAPKPAAAPAAGGAVDYAAVRKAVAAILDKEGYDDGSLGPVFVRLAWHASGTYDKVSKTGGSNGATMRFKPESEDGANAGLALAREALEPIKKQFPAISYADLWTLVSHRTDRTERDLPLCLCCWTAADLCCAVPCACRVVLRCRPPPWRLRRWAVRRSTGAVAALTPLTVSRAPPSAVCRTPRSSQTTFATCSAAWASATRKWSHSPGLTLSDGTYR
jgi:hypothetical protein